MRVKRRKKRRLSTDIDLTSLIDVVFLLLIFFMVVSSFHEETRVLQIALPRAANPTVVTINHQVLHITVTSDDRILLEEREVAPQNLVDELRSLVKQDGFRHLLIRGDIHASYRSIISVIDAANGVGVDGISFAVSYASM